MAGINWTIILAVLGVAGIFSSKAFQSRTKRKECEDCFAQINRRLDQNDRILAEQAEKVTEHGVEIRGIYKRIDELKTGIEGLQKDVREFLITAYQLLERREKK